MDKLKITILSESQTRRESLAEGLRNAAYQVSLARNTIEGYERIHREQPEVILIDLISIVRDGLKLFRHFKNHRRTKNAYIIFITTENGIRKFDFSEEFDDFVLAPVNIPEIDARIKKASQNFNKILGQDLIRIDELVIDGSSYEVTLGGDSLSLTHKEFELLRYLAVHRRQALTRDRLLANVWHYDDYTQTRTVDMHIRRLRKKLGPFAKRIRTVPNIGYKFL